MVSNAHPPLRRRSSCSIVARIRPPVAPIGCPSEMPEPFTFSRSSTSARVSPHPCRTASTCTAKASLTSIRSRSSKPIPARSSTLWAAPTGPIPMRDGSHPTAAQLSKKAIGSRPSSSSRSSATTRQAAAASFCCAALPAVTVPPGMIGRSAASDSSVVSARTPSSRSKTTGSPLRWGISTGTISSSKSPPAHAAPARCWLRTAYASAASREIEKSDARFSAVSIIPLISPNRHDGWERSRPRSRRS